MLSRETLKIQALLIILFLVLSVVAVSKYGYFIFASANWEGASYLNIEISPESVGANPPTITILSPENNKTYGSNVTLQCNISVGDVTLRNMSHSIENLYYQADWENQQTKVVRLQWNPQSNSWDTIITGTVNSNLTEFSTNLKVPNEGKHNITIWASESGSYQENVGKRFPSLEAINIYTFYINSSKTVTFTVDNSPPEIRILSIENKTYSTSSVPLVFALDKSNTQLSYSIDGLSNRTIAGNSSIAGLQNGKHNVTVYAQDDFGNKGMSETVFFNIDAPTFPLVPIIVASVVTIGLTATGVLVYFRRRKGSQQISKTIANTRNNVQGTLKCTSCAIILWVGIRCMVTPIPSPKTYILT